MDVTAKTKAVMRNSKLYYVTVNSTPTEKQALPVGVNGHVFNIPRDIKSVVPEQVIEVLGNTIVEGFTQDKGKDGLLQMTPSKHNRIAFSAIPLTKKEEDDYKEKEYGMKPKVAPQDNSPKTQPDQGGDNPEDQTPDNEKEDANTNVQG